MTVMKNLANKGALKYEKVGNAYLYSPTQQQEPEKVKSMLLDLTLDKVFNGSASELILTLVKHEKLSIEELKEIKALISKLEDNE